MGTNSQQNFTFSFQRFTHAMGKLFLDLFIFASQCRLLNKCVALRNTYLWIHQCVRLTHPKAHSLVHNILNLSYATHLSRKICFAFFFVCAGAVVVGLCRCVLEENKNGKTSLTWTYISHIRFGVFTSQQPQTKDGTEQRRRSAHARNFSTSKSYPDRNEEAKTKNRTAGQRKKWHGNWQATYLEIRYLFTLFILHGAVNAMPFKLFIFSIDIRTESTVKSFDEHVGEREKRSLRGNTTTTTRKNYSYKIFINVCVVWRFEQRKNSLKSIHYFAHAAQQFIVPRLSSTLKFASVTHTVT